MDITSVPIVFKNGIQQNKAKVTMYDYHQLLLITGVELPRTVEAHFGYEGLEEYIVVVCYISESGIITTQIPNSLLQQSQDLICYLYVTNTDEGSAKTIYRIDIQVQERGKPESTSSNPDDPHYISGLSELVNQVDKMLTEQKALITKTEELINEAKDLQAGAVQTPMDIYTDPVHFTTVKFLTAKEEK
jgi:hypothetical protein|nr:MAG TPA: BppU domain protein [Caudoviricetes sp.]